jgi:EamA domain-containing membrane protein RarD
VIALVILLVLPLALLVAGYLELASAISRQAATGVMLIVLGVGAEVWLLSNISW